MKKSLSYILSVCLCLSFCVMLASCAHKHVYKTEWTADGTHHWHVCEKEDCTELADKAEHSWDEGKITVPAEAGTPGLKIFTCSVCGETRDEELVMKTTVTDEEWAKAIAASNFTVYSTVTERGEQTSSTEKITDTTVDQFISRLHPLPEGASFTYDPTTNAYIFECAEAEATEGDITTKTYSDKYIFYFEDGKIVRFAFAEGGYTEFDKNTLETVYDDTRSGEVTHSYEFTDYGTTVAD